MNNKTYRRTMNQEERAFLEGLLRNAPARWKVATENMVVLWACSMLVFVLCWAVVGWVGRVAFAVNIGWKSPFAPLVLLIGGAGITILSALSTVRWIKSRPDYRALVRTDLAENSVLEEELQFVEAKVLEEPEHGGLMYFFRTPDNRVFVIYDHESQDLGAGGEDPHTSAFQPRAQLTLARAPVSRIPISKNFSGPHLPAGDVMELAVDPKLWPAPDEFCDVAWLELENRFVRVA